MSREKGVIVIISLLLVISTFAVYWQVSNHGFFNLDDPYYVVDNRHVNGGLSSEGLAWAFRFSKAGDQSYWHPLTWYSHMIDTQLFGLDAGKHHVINVLYHAANAVLLFLLLAFMTGAVWKSAFVAAVFALHPVNVESVAWIAERKNLLSTMFWLLTLMAYYFYARKPGIFKYLAVAALLATGLLCKPMLVTVPFVLLLLDYWPLQRVRLREEENGIFKAFWTRENMKLVYEKIPLLVISLTFMAVTSLSLAAAKQNLTSQAVPMALKIQNALTSYGKYLGKLVWPEDLAIFYMFPASIPLWKVIASLGLLGLITYLALLTCRRVPALIVGWLWFLGTLVPVIGIVQGGIWPEMAERWVYVPSIGVYLAVAWGIPCMVPSFRGKGRALACVAAAVLVALSVRTWIQLGYWKDDRTLYNRCLEIDQRNYFAHYGLGIHYQDQGNQASALYHYKQAISVVPVNPAVLFSIGNIHALSGEMEEAVAYYEKSLKIYPWNPDLRVNYGNALTSMGRLDEAIDQFTEALRMIPYHTQACNNLGIAHMKKGSFHKARECFQQALEISPGFPDAARNYREASSALSRAEREAGKIENAIGTGGGDAALFVKLARLRLQTGDVQGAYSAYRKALALRSGAVDIMYELILAYAGSREYDRAIELLQGMRESQPDSAEVPYNIACLYARQGKIDEAVLWLRQAVDKGLDDMDLIRKDPDLKGIRETAFYRELVEGSRAAAPLPGSQ